jgi:hypothetical protein
MPLFFAASIVSMPIFFIFENTFLPNESRFSLLVVLILFAISIASSIFSFMIFSNIDGLVKS